MKQKERQKIIKAIDYFLDSDPDKWIDGIDELYLLVYGEKWSVCLKTGPAVSISDLIESSRRVVSIGGKDVGAIQQG